MTSTHSAAGTGLPVNDDERETRWRLHDELVSTASGLHAMIRYTQIAWQQGDEDDKAMIDQALDVLLGLSINLEKTAYEI